MTQLGVMYKSGDVVSANYSFRRDRNEDLPFFRNEELKILNIATDPNWAHATNSVGDSGLIPLNYVQLSSIRMDNLRFQRWYHGRISRHESEQLLCSLPPGSFLVRDSDLFTGDLTLCVVGPPVEPALGSIKMGPTASVGINIDQVPPTNVQHYHIVCKQRFSASPSRDQRSSSTAMYYSLDEFDWFSTLTDLIQYYSVPDSGLVAPLKYPVPDIQRQRLTHLRENGWIISRKELLLEDQIGRGEFGEVLRATYRDSQVAVKMYKKTACKLAITYEAALMTNLSHPNLVAFIGLVYEPEDEAIYLVTEYVAQGNLLTYLHSRTRDEVSERHKLQFGLDACRGLAFLEERSIVHRDIAARNILLSGQSPHMVAKVADFGMARDLAHNIPLPVGIRSPTSAPPSFPNRDVLNADSNLSPREHSSSDADLISSFHNLGLHDNAAIPIKWTAPEAVRKRMANQALRQIMAGYRMKAPEGCPVEIYRLMRRTWNIDPNDRPTFSTLLKELTGHLKNLTEEKPSQCVPSVSRAELNDHSFPYMPQLLHTHDEDPWSAKQDCQSSPSEKRQVCLFSLWIVLYKERPI
ncbi:c-src tyrosine kinase [Paragonimus westermani]|uniref:Tyrosine-protein kinase n=1 Tax=Paragonimus westermani TaxID=34504 RepID=A0A5J4NA38_9TREM|nr:c-src tyrosine kinase [Paragonimus westermani]